ncbi:MAG: ankyrin repeat domain-containing protein, partial [Oligoflexia bacterium]|nr:ankyrin repeat domain-containing protein [Oligoflexia bacterium]
MKMMKLGSTKSILSSWMSRILAVVISTCCCSVFHLGNAAPPIKTDTISAKRVEELRAKIARLYATKAEKKDFSKIRPRSLNDLEMAVIANDELQVEELSKPANLSMLNPSNTEMGFPLMFAVINDNLVIADILLKSGAKVDTKMMGGITSIYVAVMRNQVGMVKLLLRYKAN